MEQTTLDTQIVTWYQLFYVSHITFLHIFKGITIHFVGAENVSDHLHFYKE
jgi:hypothetical protein